MIKLPLLVLPQVENKKQRPVLAQLFLNSEYNCMPSQKNRLRQSQLEQNNKIFDPKHQNLLINKHP